MNQVMLTFLDIDNRWKPVANQSLDASSNTVTVNQSTIYSYYAFIPSSVTSVETFEESIPAGFTLEQSYPNPFNPSATIQFGLPEASNVQLVIYNMTGQHVATVVSGRLNAGVHTVRWNGRDEQGNAVASGTYLYRLETDKFIGAKRMVLTK